MSMSSSTALFILCGLSFSWNNYAEATRFCNHCQWNQSLFTCPDARDYQSVACPSDAQKCLKIVGNFTAWNDQTARYSIITGTQRVCLTVLSAQHLAIKNPTPGCRTNMATDTVIGPWSFRFRGDYCICDEDNCNHAGIVKAGYFGTLFGGVVLLLRNIVTI